MLIGISGKIGSGKDTVGNIIRYLTSVYLKGVYEGERKYSLEQFNKQSVPTNISFFEIKKFADKLKDTICEWIGCTREQLEDHDFKNTPLGEDWVKWCITTIEGTWAISTNGHPYYFATEEECRVHLHDTSNFKVSKHYMTPRLLMQLLGTQCGRDTIHPNIWVNTLFSKYKGWTPKVHSGSMMDENCYSHSSCSSCKQPFYGYKRQMVCKFCVEKEAPYFPHWIITDMRFPNELQSIKLRKGITIRINRPMGGSKFEGTQEEWDKLVERNKQSQHESETALDNAEFDYVIYNTGSIEDLIEDVKGILIQEKII